MAYNGSGTFNLASGNPVVTGTTISSTWANSTLSDIATGLSNVICKDGQSTPTANLPMGNYKFTGLAAGTSNGDSVRYEQATSAVAITGGTINGATIGATTASTGAFTTLSASSTVSGTGFSTYLASPPPIGSTTANTGSFTTLSASSTFTLSGGTANGVVYLDGSKVATSGSALVFDGTKKLSIVSSANSELVLDSSASGTSILSLLNSTGAEPIIGYSGGAASSLRFGSVTGASGAGFSEQMRLTSTGLGIGTSSPSGRLHVESSSGSLPLYVNSTASAQNIRIRLNSTDNASSVSYVMSYSHASLNKQAAMGLGGTGSIGFYVNQTAGADPTTGTLAQTIDSSGNVGIGTSSPGYKLDVNGNLGAGNYYINVAAGTVGYSNNSASVVLYSGTGAIPNTLIFNTNGSERARIDSSGNFLINTTSQVGSNKLSIISTGDMIGMRCSSAAGGKSWRNAVDGNNSLLILNNGNSGVFMSDGATSWSAYSDERFKTDLKPIENAIEKVLRLRTVTGRFKTDADGTSRSFFIAQDFQGNFEEALDSTNPNEFGLRYSETTPLLAAAIKEQQAIIMSLKAELEELKSQIGAK